MIVESNIKLWSKTSIHLLFYLLRKLQLGRLSLCFTCAALYFLPYLLIFWLHAQWIWWSWWLGLSVLCSARSLRNMHLQRRRGLFCILPVSTAWFSAAKRTSNENSNGSYLLYFGMRETCKTINVSQAMMVKQPPSEASSKPWCKMLLLQVLAYYAISGLSKWANMGILAAMIVVYRFAFFCTLKLKESLSK